LGASVRSGESTSAKPVAPSVSGSISPRLIENCRSRGFEIEVLPSAESALERVIQLVPPGADVTTGSSQTLAEIGLLALLEEGAFGWRYRRTEIAQARSDEDRLALRRSATTAEYIVGSVNALAESGEAVIADFGGTRVGAYAYGANHVIWVVGINKVVSTLDQAIARVREHVLPLEVERVKKLWGVRCAVGKLMVIEEESQIGRIRLLLVGDSLGF
jgi:hypothetical protein